MATVMSKLDSDIASDTDGYRFLLCSTSAERWLLVNHIINNIGVWVGRSCNKSHQWYENILFKKRKTVLMNSIVTVNAGIKYTYKKKLQTFGSFICLRAEY